MIENYRCDNDLPHKSTNDDLFRTQMKMLKDFLERGAITQAQYDHSTKVLIEKLPHGK